MNPDTRPSTNSRKARYLMIGGFLGAGKTTAMGALGRYLVRQGLRVGLITNDQAGGLVDTRLLRSQGFTTEEIAGGCFCCRFNTLVEAAGKLTAANAPDVFVAEPVGSCTDLIATVSYPLRRMYGDAFVIAPLSVLVDPMRAMRIFGLAQGPSFSSKVAYIFKKQLEEAELIVISKSDLVTAAQLGALRDALSRHFPRSQVLSVSVRQGIGIDAWFEGLLKTEHPDARVMALDYDVYADGEARLGWLNATLGIRADRDFDANAALAHIAKGVQERLRTAKAEIAHLKLTFSPDDALAGEIASIHCVGSETVPEPGMILDGPSRGGQVIVNLRAESTPDQLLESLTSEIASLASAVPGLAIALEHEEHFRPGRPVPTYRDGVEMPTTNTANHP